MWTTTKTFVETPELPKTKASYDEIIGSTIGDFEKNILN